MWLKLFIAWVCLPRRNRCRRLVGEWPFDHLRKVIGCRATSTDLILNTGLVEEFADDTLIVLQLDESCLLGITNQTPSEKVLQNGFVNLSNTNQYNTYSFWGYHKIDLFPCICSPFRLGKFFNWSGSNATLISTCAQMRMITHNTTII